MHASMIQTLEYRALERQRRRYNVRRRQAQGLMRICGLDPRLIPCLNPEGTHRERKIKTRPERSARRFWTNVVNLFYYNVQV